MVMESLMIINIKNTGNNRWLLLTFKNGIKSKQGFNLFHDSEGTAWLPVCGSQLQRMT